MLKSLERLQKLVSRPAHAYRPTMQTFPDLDTHRLADDMGLREKGKERGESDQPPSSNKSYDAVEGEIQEAVGAAQKRAHEELENQLAGYRQRLIDLDFESRFSDIKAIALGGLADLKQELQTGIDDLHGLRKDFTLAESWYDAFRKMNNLVRPAKITTPRSTFFKWLLIVILVLGELLLNGELLSKGNELGLVGGIVEALIFAALNVAAALMFAYFLIPYVNHRNWVLKFIGLLSIAAYLAWMLILNLGLAHYREVSGSVIGGAGEEVMVRLLNAPLALSDFQSWLLFALGCLFSLIACIDGLLLRDLYPGYAAVDKALRVAREKYATERRAAIEELGDVRRDYEDALTQSRSELSKRRSEHEAIISHRLRMLTLFDEHQSQLEKAGSALFRIYRDANIEARTEPPPDYFSEGFSFNRTNVTITKEGEWNTEKLQSAIAEAQTQIDGVLTDLGKEFDIALKRYRELDDLAPDT
jgi:hypothetical protein